MGHLQQAGHDSLADADGEMPAPAGVSLRGRAGPNAPFGRGTGGHPWQLGCRAVLQVGARLSRSRRSVDNPD